MRRSRGQVTKVKSPLFHSGRRDNIAVEFLGSTGGNIRAHGATVITATAADLVYTLPAPQAGDEKFVVVDYTGNADDLIIACAATSGSFNLSGKNTIIVSSSNEKAAFDLYAMSTLVWWCNYSGHRTDLSTDIVLTASTIKSTTDVT